MSDQQALLQQALAEHYDIREPLGAGGMATVYRARDLKHGRDVAIKVLHPQLVHDIGIERFLREIRIIGALQHPHILPLYDSGEVGGLLYYTMPLVTGDTLRARLDRERQLPLEEAIHITRDVAGALAHAHTHGIVHRDIKPENILLSGGEAVVTDFGIAHIARQTGESRLTATGVGLGTPAYMSPEQITGDPVVDPRTDVYSLGCLLYEMIAGQPPFTGPTAESIVLQHLGATVPRVSVVRPGIATHVDGVITRALAKVPADRFASVEAFLRALATPAAVSTSASSHRALRRVASWLMGAAAAAIATGLWWSSRPTDPLPDPAVIAVLPFRVVASDSGLGYLREGMVDLLSTQLGAIAGTRPLDPRSVLNAWRRDVPTGEEPPLQTVRTIAQRLGSDRVVLGEVIATPTGIRISARLIDFASNRPVEAAVDGALDNLFSLVDQLTSRLAAASVGEPPQRLAELTSASLPAVRLYLEGRAALRRGALEQARQLFTDALGVDSTFALAALGMASTGVWSPQGAQAASLRRGLRTGYALRERLPRRDQLLFEAFVPAGASGTPSAADQLQGWERAAEASPESPDVLFELADRLWHAGEQVGIRDAIPRARTLFWRAYSRDSTSTRPLAHLLETDDQAELRRLRPLAGDELTRGDNAGFLQWRVALALNNASALADVRQRLRSMHTSSITRIVGLGQRDTDAFADVDTAAAEFRRRFESGVLTWGGVHPVQTLHSWAMNRGLRREASTALALIGEDLGNARASIVFQRTAQVPPLDAVFWDGDHEAARQAAERLVAETGRPRPQEGEALSRFFADACVLAVWVQWSAGDAAARGYLPRLHSTARERESARLHGTDPLLCLTLMEALLTPRDKLGGPSVAVVRLDSILTTGPFVFGSDWGTLALARIFESLGRPEAALRVARLRSNGWDTGPLYLSTYLRTEGRLLARLGDREGAVRAFRRFLALRARAEPALQAVSDSVQADLAAVPR